MALYDTCFKNFHLVWLTPKAEKSAENYTVTELGHQRIKNFKTFDNVNQCQHYIERLPNSDSAVVVISNSLDQQHILSLHKLKQVSLIYLHCMEDTVNEMNLANDFSKIIAVSGSFDKLIAYIKFNWNKQLKIKEPLVFHTFDLNYTRTSPNRQFLHSMMIIDALFQLPSTSSDIHALIRLCKQQCQDSENELTLLNEFEQQYVPEQALSWYIRCPSLDNLLNKSLKTENLETLFACRFFIRDLFQQMIRTRCPSTIQVYRSHWITQDQLKTFQQSIGNFISISSFLSASTYRQQCLTLMKSNTNNSVDNQPVLFEIQADPLVMLARPFSVITAFNDIADPSEVLFMLGSIFRLTDVLYDKENGVWMIRMKVSTNNVLEISELMEKEFGHSETNLTSFGQLLRRMAKSDFADNLYHDLLGRIPSNDPTLVALYQNLGQVAGDKGDYENAVHYQQKLHEILMKTRTSNYVSIASAQNSIGEIYRKRGDYDRALQSYNAAVALFEEAKDENHVYIGAIYNNKGLICKEKKLYTEAIECFQQALDLWRKHLPQDHPYFGSTYNNMGIIYRQLQKYDQALEFYNLSLEIKLQSLSPVHPLIGSSYANIGLVHAGRAEHEQALAYLNKASIILHKTLPAQHPDILRIKEHIERISSTKAS